MNGLDKEDRDEEEECSSTSTTSEWQEYQMKMIQQRKELEDGELRDMRELEEGEIIEDPGFFEYKKAKKVLILDAFPLILLISLCAKDQKGKHTRDIANQDILLPSENGPLAEGYIAEDAEPQENGALAPPTESRGYHCVSARSSRCDLTRNR